MRKEITSCRPGDKVIHIASDGTRSVQVVKSNEHGFVTLQHGTGLCNRVGLRAERRRNITSTADCIVPATAKLLKEVETENKADAEDAE